MLVMVRVGMTLISAVAAYYFVYWMVDEKVSWVAAGLVGGFIWLYALRPSRNFFVVVLRAALVTGAIGFCAGFFGPILFSPGANQGPLVGLFVTGPLAFVLGATGGAIVWFIKRPSRELSSREDR